MSKIVNEDLKAKAKAKAWTFEAKAVVLGPMPWQFGLVSPPRGQEDHITSDFGEASFQAVDCSGY